MVVLVQADSWNADFGESGGSVAHGDAWGASRSYQGRVRARGGSNDDDLSGFCRSSDDLSNGRGGYSMGHLEARVPGSTCLAELGRLEIAPVHAKTPGNAVPIDSANCRRSK